MSYAENLGQICKQPILQSLAAHILTGGDSQGPQAGAEGNQYLFSFLHLPLPDLTELRKHVLMIKDNYTVDVRVIYITVLSLRLSMHDFTGEQGPADLIQRK